MVENGFRAFHRAKLSSQDTQVSSKNQINNLRPYTCGAELYVHEYLRTHRYTPIMDGQTDKLQYKINIPFSLKRYQNKAFL